MSKKPSTTSTKLSIPGFTHLRTVDTIEEYQLKSNGLRILYHHRPETGVVSSNITYFVGARDEARGETGVAHMLEHMLFKPTEFDIAAESEPAAILFERETGCVMNANTWKDRTTYYFSYPAEHLGRALKIEAERMIGVVLTDDSLIPERANVLSEFDMYNGDPYSALNFAMVGTAYHSHPYGHETLGYREDIERFSVPALERFYRRYYRPDNAVLMVVGDIDRKTALASIKNNFEAILKPTEPIPRTHIVEPKQEGLRRISVERPSKTNIVSLGFKHAGFPSEDWFVSSALLEILTSGPESVLHKALVDTGIATSVDGSIEPTSEENLGTITITLAETQTHESVEALALTHIRTLSLATATALLKKVKAKLLTDELFARHSSLRIVQELTEYSAAGDWTMYTKTPEMLEKITAKKILDALSLHFNQKTMTIGYFIGTEK